MAHEHGLARTTVILIAFPNQVDGEEAWHRMTADRDKKETQTYEQADLERIRAKLFSNLKISAISIALAIAILSILARLSPELLPEALVRMLP